MCLFFVVVVAEGLLKVSSLSEDINYRGVEKKKQKLESYHAYLIGSCDLSVITLRYLFSGKRFECYRTFENQKKKNYIKKVVTIFLMFRVTITLFFSSVGTENPFYIIPVAKR